MTSFTTSNLTQEVERISAAVRSHPLEPSHRLAMAQLRLLRGEYSKALQQVQLACQFDADLMPEAQLIRMLVRSEQVREAVFAGKIMPDLLAEAPAWLDNMIKSLKESGDKAVAMRSEALSEAPASKGVFGESSPFDWIADGDERLGPIIEVILGGTYYWIPFDMVVSLRVTAPQRAMDLVWAPVELELNGSPPRIAFMPSRYPLSSDEKYDETLLGDAETVWHQSPDGSWYGYGRRVWYVDGEPLGMFEAGRIAFER